MILIIKAISVMRTGAGEGWGTKKDSLFDRKYNTYEEGQASPNPFPVAIAMIINIRGVTKGRVSR